MTSWRDRLRHAFAVDPPGPAVPTAQEQPVVDRFCRAVVRRHLTTPGLMALELGRPLNFVASAAMHFAAPGVWALAPRTTYQEYRLFSGYLERRGSGEYLAQRIEHFERLRSSPQPKEPTANDETD